MAIDKRISWKERKIERIKSKPLLSYIRLEWTGEQWDIWDPCGHTYLEGSGGECFPTHYYSDAVEFLMESDWDTCLFGESMESFDKWNADLFLKEAIVPGTKIHLVFYWSSSYYSGPDGDSYDSEISEKVWRVQQPKDWLYLGIEMAEQALSQKYLLKE
jgi:hypothetical protein